MKIALVVMIALHGLMHLLGFAKAFGLGSASQLKHDISKVDGILWFTDTALLLLTAFLLLTNIEWWWIVSIMAVINSQVLIVSYWPDARVGTIANIIIAMATVVGYCTWDFKSEYKDEVNGLLERPYQSPVSILTEEDLKPLPRPVQNYIRYSGAIGQPKIKNFKVEFTGQIRKNAQSAWMPFTSEQYNFLETPTRLFFMKAKMKGLPVAGFHAFKNGEATMDIRLLSLFNVQYQSGKEMNIAETVTFFNDMCCMAPATLIDKRIEWLETDSLKVKARFTNNNIAISAWLFFNKEYQLINFISEDRYAVTEDGSMKQFPWSTPIAEYTTVSGHLLGGAAETIYHYPEGDLTYGTFKLTSVEYNCKDLD